MRAHAQLLAERRQLHAARGAQDERHAEILFQFLDRFGQRRLRQMQRAGRRANAALLSRRQEGAQLMNLHVHADASITQGFCRQPIVRIE
jgi:hypothetical protein